MYQMENKCFFFITGQTTEITTHNHNHFNGLIISLFAYKYIVNIEHIKMFCYFNLDFQ